MTKITLEIDGCVYCAEVESDIEREVDAIMGLLITATYTPQTVYSEFYYSAKEKLEAYWPESYKEIEDN